VIYGARLRQARELASLTQRALAVEAGIPQAYISRAENDSVDLGPERLAEIATILDFPVEFFCWAPSVRFHTWPVHFRSQAGMRARQADQARSAGEIIVEAALRMRQALDTPPLALYPQAGCSPAEAAAYARNIIGLRPTEPATGLPVLLEHAGILVVALPLSAQRRDAFSVWYGELPVLALLDTDAGDRQLWSTAHELGHLLLHRGVGAGRGLEQCADEFAMHFLTPPGTLIDEIPDNATIHHFALLKRRWGVSMAAMIRMARRLEKIDQQRYTSLFRQMSARGERLRERVAVTPTKPRGFRAMAELLHGPAPTQPLALQNRWTEAFAEEVLRRHAVADELPNRTRDASNVLPMGLPLGRRRSANGIISRS